MHLSRPLGLLQWGLSIAAFAMNVPTPPTGTRQPSAFDLNGDGFAETSLPMETLRMRWEAIHTDAQTIGKMAQLAREPITQQIHGCPDLLSNLSGDQRDFALNTLADIEVMLKPGVTALQNMQASGADVTAPALALWCEFHRCRQALMDLVEANRLT